MFYQWDFAFLLRYTPLFWKGVLVTLAYTAGTIFLGLIIGLLIGLGRLSRSKLVNIPLIAFIEAFRCTPLLVQIVWFYYALPVLLNIQIPATTAAVLVLSCYTGAFYAEIFRDRSLRLVLGGLLPACAGRGGSTTSTTRPRPGRRCWPGCAPGCR